MTTYNLNGISIYYDNNTEQDVGVKSSTSFSITVPDSTTSLRYTVLPLAPGDTAPDDLYVEITVNETGVRVDGQLFQGNDNGPDTSIFQIDWDDNGTARSSTVLVLEERDANVPPFGVVDVSHIFLMGGDALPTFNSIGEFNDFFANDITGFDTPPAASPFGPDKDIPFSLFAGTFSEDDVIVGDETNNSFDGGLGNDHISGLDGDDTLIGDVGNDTLLGGNGNDELEGGEGNDSLNPGDNQDYETVRPGTGNDTVNFSDMTSPNAAVALLHDDLNASITATVDVDANTGSINKGANGTTTLINVQNPANAFGLDITGTDFDDTFNISLGSNPNGFMQLQGGAGDDTFNLNSGDNHIRLDYRDSNSTGVVLNLATGAVSDDGLGGQDTINGAANVSSVRTTMMDDDVIGSSGDDIFILMAGNDTVDGGDGFDRLRFDRNGVDAVTVDLEAGTATGMWRNEAFSYDITSIEDIRGSRDGNDDITGANGQANHIDGRGGDDTIDGGDQNDTLIGNDGNDDIAGEAGDDYIEGNDGNDILYGDAGNDELHGGDGNDTLEGGDGRDSMRGDDGNDRLDASGGSVGSQGFGDFIEAGLGQDTIIGHEGLYNSGGGIDIGYGNLSGIDGLTLTVSSGGSGTAVSGDGRVNDTFTYADYFEGSQDSDSMTGSDDDRFEGWAGLGGADTIDGGGGYDEVNYSYEHDYFNGTGTGIIADLDAGTVVDTQGNTDQISGIEGIRGSIFGDMLDASAVSFDVALRGEAGNDTILGGSGSDFLRGGDGNDSINPGDNDDYDGIVAGAGNDTINLTDVTNGSIGLQHWDLDAGITHWINVDNNTSFVDKGANGSTSIINVANAVLADGLNMGGTDHNDTFNIRASSNVNVYGFIEVFGGAGDDTYNFFAGAGLAPLARLSFRSSDISNGVTVNLGTGIVSDDGFGGEDTITGVAHMDQIRTTMMDDDVIGSSGDDIFILMAGNDTVDGGDGFDRLRFDRNGVDAVTVDLEAGTATGMWRNEAFSYDITSIEDIRGSRDGDDDITGANGQENSIHGRGGDDTIDGGDQNDTLIGNDGNDDIEGGDGNDYIEGNDGNDIMDGNAGDDELYGDDGNDDIAGDSGADTLHGDDGNDTLYGDAGNDELHGGDGADTLEGGTENDTLYGDAGNDRLLGGDGADEIFAGTENDYLQGDLGNDALYGGSGNDTVFAGGGNDTVGGGAGDDEIGGGEGADQLWGGLGADTIFAGNGADQIGSGAQADEISGGGGNDTIWAGDGDDTVYGSDGDDNISGSNGNDDLWAGEGNDTIFAGNGNDRMSGLSGNDEIWAGSGNDEVFAGGGNDTVLGAAGNDDLWGGADDDRLDGGSGQDTLRGGSGDDTLIGGADSDVFVFSGGADQVNDFATGDHIDLSGVATITDFTDLVDFHLGDAGSGAVIDDGQGNSLTLDGIDMNTLVEGDFIFVA